MTTTATQPVKNWKNLLGVCACIGEDFGFNPIWLRIAFGAGLVWSPVAVISAYLGLGVIVGMSRLMVAKPWRAAAAPADVAAPVSAENENAALPLAA